METRNLYFHREGSEPIRVLADGGSYCVSCAMPILSEGDIVGCVASVTDQPENPHRDLPGGDVETKLILTAAGFLGKQIEG